VHDKQVRRRRAVLALLVGVSLILLTAYFGESPSSPLHSMQRGIVEVLSPIQEGASKVLSPVRDIAGWFSDNFNAKSQRDQLRREVNSLTAQLDQAKGAEIENQQLRHLLAVDQSLSISSRNAVTANVIGRDPTLWYQTIEVDKGSQDGVHADDPVVGDRGLVGKVSTVGPNFSIVTLLTDHTYAVAAQVLDQSGDTGVLVPAVGNNEGQLLLQNLPSHAPISAGQQVVTAGFTDPGNSAVSSLYPPGIPIGTVSNANQDTLANSQQVQVQPLVDLRHLSVVQILTHAVPTTQRAQAP
jgi:rod shape-determining protein MreC